MAESRLQRWSRKKTKASKEVELAPPSTTETEPSSEERDLTINEALPEHEVLEKYDLPDPDAIELGTDITGFMRKEIPELLRRRALRSLWKSNPVLAVLDGLNDYDEDFTDAATAPRVIKTLYKVGQGFDRTPKVDEQVEDQIQEQAETSETIAPAVETERIPERVAERSEPEIAVESLVTVESTTRHVEPVVAEAEAEPAPRYRPRMRFDC
ncbi:DUF3306 domain-containing protein [Marinobacter changyiensis]|uniref:DUF3306 domain-containing protein n=1 Tax=Marinobacter changyiensis TaxID=2604091 RepID=UPI0012658291|nr:DUF3306 domain-containing protein [Marinobacter changyiensis]